MDFYKKYDFHDNTHQPRECPLQLKRQLLTVDEK